MEQSSHDGRARILINYRGHLGVILLITLEVSRSVFDDQNQGRISEFLNF